jgi:hypothetical protein
MMVILKRRSRIVSFRLSLEEYEVMKERCISEGARSISDYARIAACSGMSGSSQLRHDMEMETTLRKLRRRMEKLDHEVRRLTQLVEVTATPETADAAPARLTAKKDV